MSSNHIINIFLKIHVLFISYVYHEKISQKINFQTCIKLQTICETKLQAFATTTTATTTYFSTSAKEIWIGKDYFEISRNGEGTMNKTTSKASKTETTTTDCCSWIDHFGSKVKYCGFWSKNNSMATGIENRNWRNISQNLLFEIKFEMILKFIYVLLCTNYLASFFCEPELHTYSQNSSFDNHTFLHVPHLIRFWKTWIND